MKDLSDEQIKALTKAFDTVNAAMKDVAAVVVEAMQPVLVAVNKLMKDPTFQDAVIAALEQELERLPRKEVNKRIELAAQLKTWRKMKNAVRYCAMGDYGVEADFATIEECKAWIKKQSSEMGDDVDTSDYYTIRTFTPAELAAMPED